MDTTAKLIYRIDPNACHAKNERGILLKPLDYDCASSFHLERTTGILSIAKLLDRETVETFQVGLIVEDINSETGPQIATCNNIFTTRKIYKNIIGFYFSNHYY